MKALGIVRSIDPLGRLVIPAEVRKAQGWDAHAPMEMFMDGDKLVIQVYRKEQEKNELVQHLDNLLATTENEAVKNIAKNAIEFINGFYHMYWYTNRPSLICNRTSNGLTDPPCCVSRKFISATIFKFIDSFHQSNISFLN